MILNGEEIINIGSLRIPGVFDFASFWRQREAFLALIRQGGVLNGAFYDNEAERELLQVIDKWLDNSQIGMNYLIEGGKLCKRGNLLQKQNVPIVDLGETLKRKYERLHARSSDPRFAGKSYHRMECGLIALYRLLGDDLIQAFDVDACLNIIAPELGTNAGFCLLCTKDTSFPQLGEITYPLAPKVIVNTANHPIRIRVGTGDAIELLPGECVVGVFHEDACYCLLPRTGDNERVQLNIRYNWAQGRMSLSILDKRTGSEEEVKDVISFYIDEYGYAYVTKEGKVVIPESERFNMYPLKSAYRFHSDDSIIAVYMDGPIFEFIVSSD